ncbi:MAG: hypothetical protein IIB31_06150 [Chloroflexi bacterium]|nr:hypothetical protein [Chloroflexota bacterium]
MADYIYWVQMDIPADKEEEFNRVYDTQHVPNIIKAPGVHSCTRYKLVSADVDGVARYAAVYEVDSPEVPTSDGWKAESEKGDWPTLIRPYTTNRSHLIFKKTP